MKYAAVVIWFNPTLKNIENLNSLISSVDKIYISDNSINSNETLIDNIPLREKFIYIPNYDNLGIATAQNEACQRALIDGYDWVLFMDQDSSFETSLNTYISLVENYYSQNRCIAIFSPNTYPYKDTEQFVEQVISSGSIVKLSAWKECGGFLDKLFIDEVDTEFCWRIRKCGYSICRLNQIKMMHVIGTPFIIKILGKECTIQNHSYIRTYYVIRNRLYMIHTYFSFKVLFTYTKYNLRDLFYILFFEKDKIRKIDSYFKGMIDFVLSKYGKIEDAE